MGLAPLRGPFLVAGLGRAGLAAARALARDPGPDAVAAWDASSGPAVADAARELEALGVGVVLGGDPAQLASAAGCVVKSPGIDPAEPWLAGAGLVIDELELGWRLRGEPLVAVTGTNGKTTTATFLAAALGATVAGNTDFGPPLSEAEGPVVCEASSYQLECCPELVADVAVLTNLSRDHLHRHGSMDAYAAAKLGMFARGDRVARAAVIGPGSGDLGERIAAQVGRAVRVGSDYRLLACESDLAGCRLEAGTPHGAVTLELRVPGEHNAMNALCALAASDVLGVARDRSVPAIASAPPPPGRLEHIPADGGFDVLVDFAHNPGSIHGALSAARALARGRGGRLLAVVSSAGTLDPGMRPAIGAAAAALADELVLTTGSLLGEAPASILAGMAAGAPDATAEPDRRTAIARALTDARAGDIVIVCGRGARPVLRDDADGSGEPFDDRAVVRELLAG